GSTQVPAGTYTRALSASASAQPGFDRDAWVVSDWNCLANADANAYAAPVTLVPGQTMVCGITVTDSAADLSTWIDRSGDVAVEWDGVAGTVGTEFDTVIRVANSVGGLATPTVDDLRLSVRLGDNVELVDPQSAPD